MSKTDATFGLVMVAQHNGTSSFVRNKSRVLVVSMQRSGPFYGIEMSATLANFVFRPHEREKTGLSMAPTAGSAASTKPTNDRNREPLNAASLTLFFVFRT
jgi:hypothetical protein